METRTEIAARLGINRRTLSATLSVLAGTTSEIKPTESKVIKGKHTHLYDETAAEKIAALFKTGGDDHA